jgi:hypothetical protein
MVAPDLFWNPLEKIIINRSFCLSSWRLRFYTTPTHTGFMECKVPLKWIFFVCTSVFPCQYHSNNTPCLSPSFIKLLPEGQAGEGWGLSSKVVLFRVLGASERTAEARVTTATQHWVHPPAHPHCCSLRLARFTLPPTVTPSPSLPLPLHYRLPSHRAFCKVLVP